MVRQSFDLKQGETIILSDSFLALKKASMYETVELTLTNNRLFKVKRGLFGNVDDFTFVRIENIKVIDGDAQVFLEKNDGTGNYMLQIHFVDDSVYTFYRADRHKIALWANEISKLLTGRSVYILKKSNDGVLTSVLKKSLSEVLDVDLSEEYVRMSNPVYKEVVREPAKEPVREEVSCKCISCMAPLVGYKGSRVKCEYCDTIQVL